MSASAGCIAAIKVADECPVWAASARRAHSILCPT